MGINFNIKLPTTKWDEVVGLYQEGNRIPSIAKQFSVSPGTIRNCLIKMKVIIKKDNTPHNWKGGKRKTTKGYILIYSPDHPRAIKKYVFEHILVWEIVSGRPLPKDYIIHHLNGIKDDNRFDNLLATTKQKHHILFEPYKKRIHELEEKNKRLNQLILNRDVVG